jgi:hypothetical protein
MYGGLLLLFIKTSVADLSHFSKKQLATGSLAKLLSKNPRSAVNAQLVAWDVRMLSDDQRQQEFCHEKVSIDRQRDCVGAYRRIGLRG